MENSPTNTTLSLILNKFFYELEKRNIIYCVCGNYKYLPYFTDNDVDLWVDNPSKSIKLLKNYSQRTKIYNLY